MSIKTPKREGVTFKAIEEVRQSLGEKETELLLLGFRLEDLQLEISSVKRGIEKEIAEDADRDRADRRFKNDDQRKAYKQQRMERLAGSLVNQERAMGREHKALELVVWQMRRKYTLMLEFLRRQTTMLNDTLAV